MNLRKSILALSVVAGIVAAPMTVFAAHTHSWGSPQYYGYEDEMPGIYDDWDRYLQADGLRMGSSGSFPGSGWSRSRWEGGCAFFFLAISWLAAFPVREVSGCMTDTCH